MRTICPSARLFDAHNHLQLPHPTYTPAELVKRALQSGVHAAAVCSTGPEDWPQVAALKHEHPDFVHAQYGVHPWWLTDDIAHSEAWADELRAILVADSSAGVGETGLDKTRRSKVALPVQKAVCLQHLRIARDLRRPVTLHCVRAYGSLLELLETFRADECVGASTPFPTCVLHGFRGPSDLVARFERIGCYFSVSGAPLDAAHLQLIKAVPKHRLLVETDAPDQCPSARVLGSADSETSAPRANEPANLAAIIRHIAAESDCDPCALARLVSANARTVFARGASDTE